MNLASSAAIAAAINSFSSSIVFHDRYWDEMVPAEPVDLALNTALLMSTVGAGLAERRVEPVMAPQRNETV